MGQPFFDPERGLRLVISGKDNYRYSIDPEYKANRPPRPIMYPKLREWFLDAYNDMIIVADGFESDDICSIYLWACFNKAKEKNDPNALDVICSHIDKDIDTCPGWHYNYKEKSKPYYINEFQAKKNLYTQMITGDVSDNIRGLEGVTKDTYTKYHLTAKNRSTGIKSAQKLLNDCKTEEELRKMVEYLYKDYYCDMWQEEFQRNYQLLCLMQERGKIPEYDFLLEC